MNDDGVNAWERIIVRYLGDWWPCLYDSHPYSMQWVPLDPENGTRDFDREPELIPDDELLILGHLTTKIAAPSRPEAETED